MMMSDACGAQTVECMVCVGCTRWAWRRCSYAGARDSESWPHADPSDFEPVPRICRLILAVYGHDDSQPSLLNPAWVVKRVSHEDTGGRAPPYLLYADHAAREIVLALRGLDLARESDYALLLDNKPGMQAFDGGFVHHGLIKSAAWVLDREADAIAELWRGCAGDYRLVFAGHSLGSGVAALMAVIVANHGGRVGGVPRSRVRCYAVAPARCMSLNLAVKYADVIHSVVLQDDFLPRTSTPLEDIFKSIFCMPCFLSLVCLRDTFTSEAKKLRDPRRLYAPGRMYHIVERKLCSCGTFPPEVRTAIPVEGRFERIVLSCNATSDHAIVWIEREAQKALEMMKQGMETTNPPTQMKMEREETLAKEHIGAVERAASLRIPHAASPTEESVVHSKEVSTSERQGRGTPNHDYKSNGRPSWEELVGLK